MDRQPAIAVDVIGYCHQSIAQIIDCLVTGHARDLVALGGNFIILARQAETTWIASSAYGVVPYFYHHRATSGGREVFHHALQVADVMRQADLSWDWDYRALADLFCLEHLTGDASLHAAVRRVPAGSLLQWNGNKLDLWIADRAALHHSEDDTARKLSDRHLADHLVDLFTAELGCSDGHRAVLSASGGFDSRLLLAGQLAAGAKPDLLVMGQAGSTDRLVVEAIGRRFGLPVRAVALEAQDYLDAAVPVALATNGTKPLVHWHTYIYAKKSGLGRADQLLIGSNGETVRSFFYDLGIKTRLADLLPGAAAAQRYWRRNLRPDLTPGELGQLPSPLGMLLSDGLTAQAVRFADLGAPAGAVGTADHASMSEHLDRFYLDQRVRHFIGNGLTLYGLTTDWRTPLLSVPWVAAAMHLPRHWKLGSNWHRHAIHRLYPALLDFPEERTAAHMAAKAPPLYWHHRRRRQPLVPYVDYRQLVRIPAILALLADHASALDDLLPATTIRHLVDQLRAGQRGWRLFSILTSLAIWRWHMRHDGLGPRPAVAGPGK